MTEEELGRILRRVRWLTGLFGGIGFVSYFWLGGAREGLGFLLGALGSFGNLLLFEWLSSAIAPAGAPPQPWKTGAFVARYVVLFLVGFAIVKGLGVNPLAVVLGLLASTAAVLLSSVVEIVQSFSESRRSR